jgi:hypothetical protein
MLAHPSWDDLPWFYYPSPALEHPPPFIYGIGFSGDDILHYALKHNLCDCKRFKDFDEDTDQVSRAVIGTMNHIENRFKLWAMMDVRRGAAPDADMVITFWDNRCTKLRRKKQVMDTLDEMEEVFGSAKWYLENEDEIHQRGYKLDLSKLPKKDSSI